jgi:hypothetical protein
MWIPFNSASAPPAAHAGARNGPTRTVAVHEPTAVHRMQLSHQIHMGTYAINMANTVTTFMQALHAMIFHSLHQEKEA